MFVILLHIFKNLESDPDAKQSLVPLHPLWHSTSNTPDSIEPEQRQCWVGCWIPHWPCYTTGGVLEFLKSDSSSHILCGLQNVNFHTTPHAHRCIKKICQPKSFFFLLMCLTMTHSLTHIKKIPSVSFKYFKSQQINLLTCFYFLFWRNVEVCSHLHNQNDRIRCKQISWLEPPPCAKMKKDLWVNSWCFCVWGGACVTRLGVFSFRPEGHSGPASS